MAVLKRHFPRPAATSVAAMFEAGGPALVKCSNCGFEAPHQACGNCGYYKGEEVIKKA